MKICNKCNKELDISEFYKCRGMKDGHLNKCKECTKKDVHRHRAENIEKIREYDRSRGNRNETGYLREYRKKYPNKYKAHMIVDNAVRDKKLFKEPCEKCGSEDRIHAHHDDYLKPLNVRWLCAACHSQWHKINGEALNAHDNDRTPAEELCRIGQRSQGSVKDQAC